MMNVNFCGRVAALTAAAILIALQAGASTIAQNSAWNIQRPGQEVFYRSTAYGDSIYAGYLSATSIARRNAIHVQAEYGAALWGQGVEVRRRCQSGALASGIYNRVTSATDRAFMQSANSRIVGFAMCGNDYLQARSSFSGQSGTCNYAVLDNAGNNCRNFTELTMQYINANAHPNVKLKVVSNLYYPGFNADNVMTNCSDPETGQPINRRDKFLPLLAESNWTTCALAEQYGWVCADSFAEFMAADYDSDGDGQIDSEQIRYRSGESFEDYLDRIMSAYQAGLLRDSRTKLVAPSTSVDYLISDNTHPSHTGPTAATLFTTPGGNVNVQFATAGPYPDGKNPVWNLNGHDRMGYGLTYGFSLDVDAGPDATILECESFESAGSFQDRVFHGPWSIWIDYGDGTPESNDEIDVESFELSHQYTQAGSYTVDVLVETLHGVTGGDTATVLVQSAEDATQNLIGAVNALQASGALSFGHANAMRQSLIMAGAKLAAGQDTPARSMLNAFIAKVAASSLSPANAQALTAYAERALAAVDCTPGVPGSGPNGRPRPNHPHAPLEIPDDLPEELWEIDEGEGE